MSESEMSAGMLRGRGSRRPVRGVVAVIAMLALAVGCNGSDGDALPPAGSGSSVPGTSSSTVPAVVSGAEDAWRTLWDETGKAKDLAAWRTAVGAVADPEAVEVVEVLAGRTVTSSPKVVAESDTVAVIEDCVIVAPRITSTASFKVTGRVEQRDGGPRITTVATLMGQPCVSKSMADDVIEGYEAYQRASYIFFSPANPEHELLNETTTGDQLTHLQSVLRDFQRRGVELRGEPAMHPEVTAVRSAQQVVVTDCATPDPTEGVYDARTSARLPDVDPVEPGRTDIYEAVMQFEGERWKVAELRASVGVKCAFAPTEKGLRIVGD